MKLHGIKTVFSLAKNTRSAELHSVSIPGKTSQIDHPIPVQIDHQFRSKLTTTFQFKLTT
ncbi:MAG: hypothetical protein PHF81_07910 [Flavobacterium sp.]|nr:hypothetical protein [Flavobacterium sp.]